jgi:hypothetical protein
MSDGKNWVVGRTLEQAMERAKILAGDAMFTLEQDEDVLDTFFSSALWPFSIMGWPDNVRSASYFFLDIRDDVWFRPQICKTFTLHLFSSLVSIHFTFGSHPWFS